MVLRIQKLTVDDIFRLKSLRLSALRESAQEFASTLAEASLLSDEQWAAQLVKLTTFVAVDDLHDIGMARIAWDSNDPQLAHVISLWVDPNFRQRGVGRALVETLHAYSEKVGASRLMLQVRDGNDPARQLYQSVGFAPTGRRERFPPPRDKIEDIEMNLTLAKQTGG